MGVIETLQSKLAELERELLEWQNAPKLPGSSALNANEIIDGLQSDILKVKKQIEDLNQ